MSKLIHQCIYLFLFLWTGILTGQNRLEYAVSRIDTSLLQNAEAVIRFEETRLIIKSPREYVQQVTKAVTIFDEDSREALVIVPYDKYSSADLVSVFLYNANGKLLRKMKKSEIVDVAAYSDNSILTDERFLGVRSFGGQLPYTLEYKWKTSYHETLSYPDWHPQRKKESIEHAKFILETPQNLIIHTKTLNADFTYKKETDGERKIQSWTLINVKAIPREASGPPDHEILPLLMMSPSVFQVGEYTGSMSDWKSFGAFLYMINKDREKMPPVMVSLIKQMTANCKTPKEKIDTMYHWLQHNMRYVSVQLGIGGWQSFDATYVEKNRYGDCKALSTFMKGMLREVGIDAYQVVIRWDEENSLFPDDFIYNDFNHMMINVPSENMWLECTSNNLPTGEIDKDEQNKKVLLITPEGGKISRTPSIPDSLNTITTQDTIFATDPMRISGREEHHGNQQRIVRSLYYYASPEEQRKYFLEHCHLTIDKLDQLHISTEKSGSSSSIAYDATLSKFGNVSGIRLFIPVNSIQPPHNSCSGNTDRKTDFVSIDNYTEKNDIYIALPPDYVIEYLPSKSVFDFKGNHYSVELNVEGQFIHVHHQITEAPMRLTPTEYTELCAYNTSVAKSNSQMIVLKKSKA
ncbi:MAG: transglutaminase-like domain-containing protein [Saprospiraceae bacterium]